MTSDGVMRHPSFQGMREDKNVKDIILETEKPIEKIVNLSKKSNVKNTAPKASPRKEETKDLA